MSNSLDQFEAICVREGLRITQPRRTIFDALQRTDSPLSASTLSVICPTVDKASIYRTLELFVDLRIAIVVPLGWKQRYELTSPFKTHHHHLHCTKCNAIIDIRSQKIEQLIADITAHYAFTPTNHHFEVNGLCKNCQPQQ